MLPQKVKILYSGCKFSSCKLIHIKRVGNVNLMMKRAELVPQTYCVIIQNSFHSLLRTLKTAWLSDFRLHRGKQNN